MTPNNTSLAKNLKSKNVRFFHAINIADFTEYCRQHSILSRSILTEAYKDYTRFFSDNDDIKLGVWERTFGNLNDFGQYFWKYERAIPNAYGPITIVLNKHCWKALKDIQITRKTITAEDNEPISGSQIDEIFSLIKGRYQLKKGFTAAEVSTSDSRISLKDLAYILVDPFKVGKQPIRKHVLNILEETRCLGNLVTENQVIERQIHCPIQESRINQLLDWSRALAGKLIDTNESLQNSLPSELAEWFNDLEEWKQHILASWLTYTFNGTLHWLE